MTTYHTISSKNAKVLHISRPIKLDFEWEGELRHRGSGDRYCGKLHSRDPSISGIISSHQFLVELIENWKKSWGMPKFCNSCLKKFNSEEQ